ncbi:histidine phosphatase family protein [Arthrobacter sp. HMWF013]|uniref:histidine phosphatase family protein n=1 Tax=Arthrobacter sp. HMWF013 TaxID=2056849 RepID=UPI000D39D9CE|nr:histidine phosphatase family protein [Arthrobacter sp. HMWF013]PTT64663.1 histidine phosphatase family protein [Arthrobacter sp. HMWF013]
MTNIILCRHGETVWHAENRYAGISDIELTRRGHDQAARLADWSRTAGLTGIYASTLTRAQVTAAASASTTGLPVRVDGRLRELDFGEGEGRTTAEMEQLFPKALSHFRSDPAKHHLPGGEDPFKAADRFVECLGDLAAQYPEGRILVVAHTTAIRLALCQLIGVPLGEYRRVFPAIRNCSLTELSFNDGYVSVLEFNTPVAASLVPAGRSKI